MAKHILPHSQPGSLPAGVPMAAVSAAPVVAVPLPGYLRLSQIIGDPEKGIPAIIPISRSTWWNKCRNDPSWPQPVRISARCTAWLASDVMALVDRLAQEGKEVTA